MRKFRHFLEDFEDFRFFELMDHFIKISKRENAHAATAAMVDFKTVYNIIKTRFLPAPHPRTVQAWLKDARVRTTKRNLGARRGGGRKWYVVADVERFIERLTK